MPVPHDRELRLALVCYGGVSLAVYMHGITKEIWRLLRASRAARDGDTGAVQGTSETVYRAFLDELRATSGMRLRVLVDIASGASAGGINAVFLAQAIATGQSLDPLTDLWLDVADVDMLLDPEQAPSHRLAKFWALPIAWMAVNRNHSVEESVETAARDEVRRKMEKFVRSRWFEPPFGGARMLHLLLDALDAMARGPTAHRLLPPGHPLDLSVTVTDYLGHPEHLRLHSPPEVIETEHRLVFSFSDHDVAGEALAHPVELAFASRATSSFPGAFPPSTVAELDRVVAERGIRWPGRETFLERMLPGGLSNVEQATLIDGAVLTNAPFKPAMDALRERPARRQVDRRIVYIDPTPDARFDFYGPRGSPGYIQTLLGALSELPREQPIRDNLEAIAERSDRIERTRAILEKIREEVEAQVENLFGYTLFLDYPTPKRLAAWRRRAQVAAASRAGYGHTAYGQVKIDGIVTRTARLLHQIGDQAGPDRLRAIADAVRDTVRARGADRFGADLPHGAAPESIAFLRSHDLSFRIRRLRLLARRMTELDAAHQRAELLPMREALYASLSLYSDCQRPGKFAALRADVRAMHDDAGPALDLLGAAMDLNGIDAATDARISEALSRLSREYRRPLLLSMLGFPFFDIATLPLLQGEGLNEYDPIRVDRIAPEDAASIRRGGAQATLKGIQFNSFGAFFSRAYRENDYLWGRLHGADRLVDIVHSALEPDTRLCDARIAQIKRALFHAILDEEEPRLSAIPALFAQLRAEIDQGK